MSSLPAELLVWSRWTLAGVMVVAGLGKLADREGFVQAAINYQILPHGLARAFAQLIPWSELASALLILSGRWVALGALLSGLLLLGFSAAIGINIVRGRPVNCGCLGKLTRDKIGWPLLLRNTFLIGLVILVITSHDERPSVSINEWFAMSTLIVSAVAGLTLFGPGLDFLRQAFLSQSHTE
ncbi:MAG: DoxX family membrane protein [Gemmatales bacterium]|nr:DoxX family membrane protein [Gemmatales bacterium]MDW8224190.1 MauE/DoxX family redox-associated membrane protein [Gemmatales bacterium]